MAEANKLFQDSGLKILSSSDLDEAANLAAKLSEIVRLARAVDVNVKFELPLWRADLPVAVATILGYEQQRHSAMQFVLHTFSEFRCST